MKHGQKNIKLRSCS